MLLQEMLQFSFTNFTFEENNNMIKISNKNDNLILFHISISYWKHFIVIKFDTIKSVGFDNFKQFEPVITNWFYKHSNDRLRLLNNLLELKFKTICYDDSSIGQRSILEIIRKMDDSKY